MLSNSLHILVVGSALYAIFALTFLVVRTFAWGRKELYAPPSGKSWNGVWYAFGQGMMPWEKESAGKHLPTFIAGIFYHLAVLAAILSLILQLSDIIIDPPYLTSFRSILIVGILSGLGLFIKRVSRPFMRGISTPDDYIANLLVTIFICAALLASFDTRLSNILYISAIALFCYMPVGKIRHCVFFFYSRILFGAFFGRRNVFPHQAPEA